jgi:hypothetical protein
MLGNLMSWCGSRKIADPTYLCIEARFFTRPIISEALQGSVRPDFTDRITYRMSPSPETTHWSLPCVAQRRDCQDSGITF